MKSYLWHQSLQRASVWYYALRRAACGITQCGESNCGIMQGMKTYRWSQSACRVLGGITLYEELPVVSICMKGIDIMQYEELICGILHCEDLSDIKPYE
jgi:hypothetical protein